MMDRGHLRMQIGWIEGDRERPDGLVLSLRDADGIAVDLWLAPPSAAVLVAVLADALERDPAGADAECMVRAELNR